MKPEAKFIFQKDEHIHSYNLYSTRKAYIIYLSLQKKKLRMQGNQPTDLVISSRLLDLAHPNCSMGLGGHTMGAFTSYDQVPFPIFLNHDRSFFPRSFMPSTFPTLHQPSISGCVMKRQDEFPTDFFGPLAVAR